MKKNKKRVISCVIIFFVLAMNVTGCKTRVVTTSASGVNVSTMEEMVAEEVDNEEEGIAKQEEAEEKTSGNITISTTLGYERYVKMGRHIRINSKIKNQGEDFTGELQILAPNGNQTVTTYAKDVAIASGETKNITIDIPVVDVSNVYRLKLLDAKGKEKIKETLSARIVLNSETPYIGILSDNISDLSYFRTSQVKVFSMDAKTFADSYLGLDTLDIIVINDFDTSLLNEQQYTALKDWVNNGGSLVLGTGSTNQKTLQLFQDDFIGGTIGKLDENGILDITVEKANVISKEENYIIHQTLEKGLGNIQVFGVDLSIYSEEKTKGKDIVEQVLLNISKTKSEQILQESGNISANYYTEYDLYNAMNVTENKNMPAVGKYAAVLIFYIILVGPILYLILKKIDKRNMMWIGVPSLSVLFALSIYGLGTNTRINKPYIGYVNILKANDNSSNTVKKETYFSVTSPSNKNYGFEVEGDYQIVAQSRNGYDYYSDPDATVDRLNNIYIKIGADKTSVKLMNNAAFSPVYFKSHGSRTLDGMYQSDIKLNNSKLEGSFLNEFGFDITNASVYSNYQLVSLGTIKNKEKAELSEGDITTIPSIDAIYQQDIVSSIINGGGYYYDIPAEDRRKAYVLEHYLQDNYYSIKDKDFLIGFVEEEKEDDLLEKIGYQYEGVTVIIIPLNVPSYQNGKDFITNIASYGTLIEGSYDSLYNYMYEDLIMEYIFPENIKITSLIYNEELNNGTYEYESKFEGVIKAYNYQTKKYDVIFDREHKNGTEEITELEAYLDKTNKMKLAYEIEENSNTHRVPIISITKEVSKNANHS